MKLKDKLLEEIKEVKTKFQSVEQSYQWFADKLEAGVDEVKEAFDELEENKYVKKAIRAFDSFWTWTVQEVTEITEEVKDIFDDEEEETITEVPEPVVEKPKKKRGRPKKVVEEK